MSTVSKRLLTMFGGIILILIALILNSGIIRPIFIFIGIILLAISNSIERNNNKFFLPLFLIIFFFFMVAIDYLLVTSLKKEPIFTYSIVSTGKNKVYNAFGYRVWKCDDNENTFKVDPLYKLGYLCSTQDMTTESINNALPKIYSDFKRYKDNYIKVTGKLSKIVNNTEIYMNTYDDNGDDISFNDNYILDVHFNMANQEVSKYTINDEITIVGKVSAKEDNKIKIIDSNFVVVGVFEQNDDYDFDVNTNIYCQYDKELWFETKEKLFFKSCINSINLNISGGNYTLEAALKNGVVTLEDLKNSSLGYLTNSKDKSIIYTFNNFKILECDPSSSKDVIIGRPEMSFDDGYCKTYTDGVGV